MWAEDCSRDFENVLLKYGFYKKRAFYLVTVDSNGKRTRKLTEIALDYDGLQAVSYTHLDVYKRQRLY